MRWTLGCTLFVVLLTAAANATVVQDANDARALYLQHCASCHGRDLSGGNAQSMIDGVWRYGSNRNAITRNIKFGISGFGMPDYQNTLSDKQIAQLAYYLDRFAARRPYGRCP